MKKLILKVILPPTLYIVIKLALSQFLTTYVVTIILFVPTIVAYLFIAKKDRDENDTRSSRSFREKVKEFCNKFLIVLLSVVLIVGVTYFVEPTEISLSFLIFLAVALCAPVEEELIYRGLCFLGADDLMGTMFASFISSMAFAVGHVDTPLTMILSFGTGFVMCILLKYTKSIQYPILAHILINTTLLLI